MVVSETSVSDEKSTAVDNEASVVGRLTELSSKRVSDDSSKEAGAESCSANPSK